MLKIEENSWHWNESNDARSLLFHHSKGRESKEQRDLCLFNLLLEAVHLSLMLRFEELVRARNLLASSWWNTGDSCQTSLGNQMLVQSSERLEIWNGLNLIFCEHLLWYDSSLFSVWRWFYWKITKKSGCATLADLGKMATLSALLSIPQSTWRTQMKLWW